MTAKSGLAETASNLQTGRGEVDFKTTVRACGAMRAFAALVGLAAAPVLVADNLQGADRLLCAPASINICPVGEACSSVRPEELNLPRFIVVDLQKKILSTTDASDRKRVTPVQTATEEGNLIYLQGTENGRAFSFIIDREGGQMTSAVARIDFNLSGFGACTPIH
jgi:hypothetical protein